jgi:hypothetical protein
MVRNTHGGSKTKSQARKSSGPVFASSTRTPRGEFERLGVVTKMLGNGMCYISVSGPGVGAADMLCVIRGKFRGRNKKHNFLGIGTEVIVGLRDWEAPAFKTIDLLEVLGTSSAYAATSCDKSSGDKSSGDKSSGDKSSGDKSSGDKSSGDKSSDVVFSEDAVLDDDEDEVQPQRLPPAEDFDVDADFDDI